MSSLRVRFFLLLAVVLVPSAFFQLALVIRGRQVRAEVAREVAVNHVESGIREHGAAIENSLRILHSFSLLEDIRTGNAQSCLQTLQTLQDIIDEGWSLVRTRADGIADCATGPSDVAFDQALFHSVREARRSMTGIYSMSGPSGVLVLPVQIPLLSSDSSFVGTLSTGLKMRWIDEVAAEIGAVEDGVIAISTPDSIIYRIPEAASPVVERFPGPLSDVMSSAVQRGVTEAKGIDGIKRVWAYDRLPSPDSLPVFLVVGLPADAIYQGANEELRRTLAAFGIWLVLVVVAASWATEKFILRDVRTLVAATEKIGSGDLSARTGIGSASGELSILGSSIDAMASRLEERQLREAQSQKLESIGQLAGGVAHDFNNLLTAIIGNGELARSALSKDHPARRDLDAALAAADRSASLTRQLLAFARRTEFETEAIRLDHMLSELASLLQRVIGEHINLDIDIGSNVLAVRIDVTSVEQVIVNLVVNSRDAMPEGGNIAISLRNISSQNVSRMTGENIAGGKWILLSVADTGSGMDSDVLARVYEPFFTTKPVGKGTGLGMAMVYGTVVQHGGMIRVVSTPSVGTTVHIFLPAIEESTSLLPLDDDTNGEFSAAGMTVLLVEDEIAVRTVVARILKQTGFKVVEAVDGQDALEKCNDSLLCDLDLLITDMVMPRKGGPELLDALSARGANFPVLIVSGYRDSVVLDALLERPNTSFLAKPFSPMELISTLKQLVGDEQKKKGSF